MRILVATTAGPAISARSCRLPAHRATAAMTWSWPLPFVRRQRRTTGFVHRPFAHVPQEEMAAVFGVPRRSLE